MQVETSLIIRRNGVISNYEQYDVHMLRRIARDKGVRAPTKLNRQELEDKLKLVDAGKLEPIVVTKRGRGRPTKQEMPMPDLREYVDKIGYANFVE